MNRLFFEWTTGLNAFGQPGERFLGVFAGNRLIGVGGLNRDPYVAAPNIGRLRHMYVQNLWPPDRFQLRDAPDARRRPL